VHETLGKPKVTAFVGWVAIGGCVLIALLTPFTIGWAAALAAVAGTLALLVWPAGRSAAAFGALSGAGAVPLYVAWLNRHGPGEVCTASAVSSHCVDEWSPWGWLVVGVALVAGGVVAFAVARCSLGWPRRPLHGDR